MSSAFTSKLLFLYELKKPTKAFTVTIDNLSATQAMRLSLSSSRSPKLKNSRKNCGM